MNQSPIKSAIIITVVGLLVLVALFTILAPS